MNNVLYRFAIEISYEFPYILFWIETKVYTASGVHLWIPINR